MSPTRTTAGARSASDAQQKVLTALRELGNAAAQQVSDHAGLAYSTTTAKLRSLEVAGLARRERHPDGAMTWQPADPATSTTAETKPRATTSTSTKDKGEGGNGSSGRPPRRRGGVSGAEPTTKADPGARTAPPDTDADRTRANTNDGPDGGGGGRRARRPKGALRAEVLAVLQDHPDTAFKVSQVCRHLPGASPGAVANALDKLVADRCAKQVADRPATYQAE